MTILWIILKFVKQDYVKDFKRNLVISFMTIVFLLHPKMTEKSLNIFKCVEIDDGYSVVKIDTNIECGSATHIKWCLLVAGPIIVIWVLACPALALVMIIYGRRHRENSKITGYFLILTQGLKPSAFYWEFINTLRKFAVLVSLLFTKYVAINLSLILLVTSARLEIWIKPYKNNEHNHLEFLAIMAGVTVITAAMVYSQDDQEQVLNAFVLIGVFFVNLRFLLEW